MAGHALHDTATGTGSFFQRIIGGISGSLLWSVLIVIIIYSLYLNLTNYCLSPFKKPQSSHTPSVTETPLVSAETTSIQHSTPVIDKPTPSKQKRFIVKFSKKSETRLQLRMYELYVNIIVSLVKVT